MGTPWSVSAMMEPAGHALAVVPSNPLATMVKVSGFAMLRAMVTTSRLGSRSGLAIPVPQMMARRCLGGGRKRWPVPAAMPRVRSPAPMAAAKVDWAVISWAWNVLLRSTTPRVWPYSSQPRCAPVQVQMESMVSPGATVSVKSETAKSGPLTPGTLSNSLPSLAICHVLLPWW